jgi:hypothetical protein
MLLNYTSSKVDIFSAHLIHNVDIEVLLICYSYTESSIQIMASLYTNPHQVNGSQFSVEPMHVKYSYKSHFQKVGYVYQ